MIKIAMVVGEGATAPTYGSDGAAGADLYATADAKLVPGQRVVMPCGVQMAIPKGYYGRIAPRSGLAVRHGLDVLAGVVDCDYRGEICVVLINLGGKNLEVPKGTRVAQIIFERADRAEFVPVSVRAFDETTRGAGGFGSTGEK